MIYNNSIWSPIKFNEYFNEHCVKMETMKSEPSYQIVEHSYKFLESIKYDENTSTQVFEVWTDFNAVLGAF